MSDITTYHRGQRNFGTGYDMIDQIEALEAKLAKAVELALKECPFRWGTPRYDKWWQDRRTIIAELTGGKDE